MGSEGETGVERGETGLWFELGRCVLLISGLRGCVRGCQGIHEPVVCEGAESWRCSLCVDSCIPHLLKEENKSKRAQQKIRDYGYLSFLLLSSMKIC